MLPLPSFDQVFASTTPNSQTVFDHFMPYGYMEIGLLLGALAVVFLVYLFWDAIRALTSHVSSKYDSPSYGGILATQKPGLFSGWFSKNKKLDSSASHRDATASGKAIAEHRRFLSMMAEPDKITRYK